MPYQKGSRLPGERASRLGHLEVIKSDLVNRLCTVFVENNNHHTEFDTHWQHFPSTAEPLPLVFGIDGSLQTIQSQTPPYKALSFVKTALLRLDQRALSKIDKVSPHPYALRDVLRESALYHATVFPLRNVSIPNYSTYDALRKIIYDSFKDESLSQQPFETFKWLVYEKWDGVQKSLPQFGCPHCGEMEATLPFDADEGKCPNCNEHILVTDMLGFHQEMSEDSAPDTIASTYMTIHETLLLFTGIKYFWENDRSLLSKCLFVKDGPLSIRAQYSKLVNPIRRFISYARKKNVDVHIIGQEKTGRFVDHLSLIHDKAPEKSIFIPDDYYIKTNIQYRKPDGYAYGKDTNYGVKVFLKYDNFHHMVLNVPTGLFKENPKVEDLIGIKRIIATLPTILSNRFEGALLPVELANGIASLSTYPSAQVLKIFSESVNGH